MSEESQSGPMQDGTVEIDVGGDRGALVILTPAEMLGHEVEISPVAPDALRVHVAVGERVARNRSPRYEAVFSSLLPGDYRVWRSIGDDEPAAAVTIIGGRVTEIEWL